MGSEAIEAVGGGERLFPPGFRFHPTDEELILYYLKRKICGRSLKLDIIAELDLYKWDPHELPDLSKWKTGDRQWFFFSPRDRKYPNGGGRSNRGTKNGYWKATGKDRTINCNSRSVGLKKTLVYYQGRAPSGQRTDWVMHEYILDEEELKRCKYPHEYYVLYKVFKKSGPGPKNGEQYGAPFVEEEWANDGEYLAIDALLVHNVSNSGATVEPEFAPPMAEINPVNGVDVHQNIPVGPVQSANEPSVITSVEELQPLVVNDDFLEMDDLVDPKPAFENNLQLSDLDAFCEFDFYNNSTEFSEMNPFESQHTSYTNLGDEAINTEVQTSYDLWTHEESNYNFMNPQATDVTVSAPSGVENPESSVTQCLKNGEDDGSDSWFSSALWAFVESVPTNPASALENNDIVNKAFERMMINANGVSGGSVESTSMTRVNRSSRSKSRGIIYFSFLGILFAILCVFVGTSIELLGTRLL